MPNGPSVRQQLIQATEMKIIRLQHIRQQTHRLEIDNFGEEEYDGSNADDSETMSVSSLSSFSSLSTTSSLSSLSETDAESHDSEEDGNPDHIEDEDTHTLHQLHALIQLRKYLLQTRVLFPNTVHKVSQLSLVLDKFRMDDSKRFRANLRVSPSTFDELLLWIEDDPVFMSTGPRPQLPLHFQLAIALFRFGHFGNAASVEAVAQWAGVSAGCVVASTRRVMVAFLQHHDHIIRWPTAEEKAEAKNTIAELSCEGWRDGFCLVDGTLVPLAEKPGFHGEGYYDRKSNYSLNIQLITLPNLRIIDYCLGYCGSTHDSTAFQASRTYKEHERLFTNGEWIWADTAYPLQPWIISPYKKPYSDESINKKYNYWVSRVRVKSEHAVGYLKGRFSSLKGLRQQIDDERDHRRALEWIRTCLVIHTLVSHIEHEPVSEINELVERGLDGEPANVTEHEPVPNEVGSRQRIAQAELKRSEVKRILLNSGLIM